MYILSPAEPRCKGGKKDMNIKGRFFGKGNEKQVRGGKEGYGEGEYDQNTLCACMKRS
jgi:hypothetical protein